MTDALLILNAGSSSLKFSVFDLGSDMTPILRGWIEPLPAAPTFKAFDAAGRVIDEHTWPAPSRVAHADAADFLLAWGRRAGLRGRRLIAAGHRVVPGWRRWCRWRRCISRIISR
jgi:acetate kinase